MNLKEIKELIEMIRGSGISEIEVEREGGRVRIRLQPPAPPPAPAAPAAPAAAAGGEAEGGGQAGAEEVVVTSPMVGTFYRSPAPGAPPFVEEGSTVERGETLCIIEAMKLMNEIEAECRGRVARILKNDAEPVEYGEPLMVLEPLP